MSSDRSGFSERNATRASNKCLTFSLGKESYAIEILKVREILRVPDITPVPHMPDYIKGVINLRGKVIPVIDLRLKFGFTDAEYHERTCMIVVCVTVPPGDSVLMGLVVDVVEEVVNLGAKDIEVTPNFGAKVDTDYILGLAKIKGNVKTVLNIDRVVASDLIQSIPEEAAVLTEAPAS